MAQFTPAHEIINIFKGDTFSYTFRFFENGGPLDLSIYTDISVSLFNIRKDVFSHTLSGGDIIVSGADNNIMSGTASAQTMQLPKQEYFLNARFTFADGSTKTYISFWVNVIDVFDGIDSSPNEFDIYIDTSAGVASSEQISGLLAQTIQFAEDAEGFAEDAEGFAANLNRAGIQPGDAGFIERISNDESGWVITPLEINTIQSLPSLPFGQLRNGASINLLGYHNLGDGGGGKLYWDANEDKQNHNGGTIISPTWANGTFADTQDPNWYTSDPNDVGAGVWVRTDGDVIDVRQFGVRADGITDNFTSLQGMFDSIENPVDIIFPKGKCMIRDTIFLRSNVSGCKISGSGQFESNLERLSGGESSHRGFFYVPRPDQQGGNNTTSLKFENFLFTTETSFNSRGAINIEGDGDHEVYSCKATGWYSIVFAYNTTENFTLHCNNLIADRSGSVYRGSTEDTPAGNIVLENLYATESDHIDVSSGSAIINNYIVRRQRWAQKIGGTPSGSQIEINGLKVIDCAWDYNIDFTSEYAGDFQYGEDIVGQSSGAVATVHQRHRNRIRLGIRMVSGSFTTGEEVISQDTNISATIDAIENFNNGNGIIYDTGNSDRIEINNMYCNACATRLISLPNASEVHINNFICEVDQYVPGHSFVSISNDGCKSFLSNIQLTSTGSDGTSNAITIFGTGVESTLDNIHMDGIIGSNKIRMYGDSIKRILRNVNIYNAQGTNGISIAAVSGLQMSNINIIDSDLSTAISLDSNVTDGSISFVRYSGGGNVVDSGVNNVLTDVAEII